MKKILSFVLVLAMVLGSVSMAFAKTATFSDVKGLSCEEAVNVLAGLGVIDGYPDGEFKPARNITRAEAVKLVIGALAMPVDEKGSYETPFTDVPNDAWYAGYVLYANKLGITKGTSATEFSPNAMVTSDQMIAFAMRALGYTEAVLQGEYPACFINKAVGLKVLKGVSTGSQPAPRGEIAQLIYNCLTKQIGSVGADGMWHGAQIADDVNIGQQKVDTMLNRLGAIEREDYELVTEDVIEDALVDLSQYHGAVVKLYENEDGDAIALAEIKTTFITGSFDDGKLEGYKLYGDPDEEHFTAGGELVAESIEIQNGAEYDADEYDLTAEGTYAVTFKGGKIFEIYSFQSWEIDKIIKVSADDVKDIAEDEPTVAGYTFPLDDDDELDTSKFVLNGADSIKDIEKNDVLYIYENPETGDISRVDVGTESVKGEFTKIRGRAANTDQDRYVVGGTTYEGADETKGADYTSELKDANIGNEYTIYLGYDGKLCYAEGEDDSTTDYVVFLQYWEPGRGNADNRVNNGKSGLSVFGTDGREELYFKKNLYKEEKELPEGVKAGVLVKITKNASGNVTEIKPVDKAGTSDVSKKGRVVEYEAALNDKSVIYNYKGDEDDDPSDDSLYSVVKPASLFDKDDVEFIQLGKTSKGYVSAALMTGASGKLDDIIILTAKLYTLKDNTEEATVFKDGEKQTIVCDIDVFDRYAKPTDEKKLMNLVYKLTSTDADGIITEAEHVDADDIALATDAGLRVENDVIFDAGDAPYEIEDGACFYMFDISENKWSTISKSTLSGLKAGEKNNQGICLKAIKLDEKNDGYDIFILLRN